MKEYKEGDVVEVPAELKKENDDLFDGVQKLKRKNIVDMDNVKLLVARLECLEAEDELLCVKGEKKKNEKEIKKLQCEVEVAKAEEDFSDKAETVQVMILRGFINAKLLKGQFHNSGIDVSTREVSIMKRGGGRPEMPEGLSAILGGGK